MKFLCDRCKTRYSIADERVRGKILKIRCKNCANVITVREGMADADADPGARRKRATTMAPIATVGPATSAPTALGAAFQSALTAKPPAALEEEWYVSIDGEQEGPFSLADAQRWVSSKAHDADLHCWSEGFDDWLPVDKVSHFRGLRQKPAAPAGPPPLPRASARMPAPDVEDEPKPLFAATMASLERGMPAASPLGSPLGSAGLGLPPPSLGRPTATPPGGVPAHANGTSTSPIASGRAAPAFDASEGATQIESPAFEDEPATAASGAFAKAASASPPSAPQVEADSDDDDLSIGEVSRVVNLSDLMRSRPAPADPSRSSGSIPNLARTGSVPRLGASGSVPRLGATGMVPRLDDGAAAASQDVSLVPPPVAATHRRGLLLLIGASAVLLAGVIVAVVLLVSGGDDITTTSLTRSDLIDTSRPDDPLFRTAPQPTEVEKPGTGAQPSKPTTKPTTKPSTPSTSTSTRPDPVELPTPTGGSLRSDEIEDMARKNSMGTQRCYMRSQKGVDAILIGDVKKIQATLDIAADGTVKDVTLSAHANNTLGKCLISTIKSWKFRASPGGLYKISLQFVAG